MSNRIEKMEEKIEQATSVNEDPALIKAIRILINEGRCETKGETFLLKEEGKVSYSHWIEETEKNFRYQLRVFGKEAYESQKELFKDWEQHLKDIGAFIE